MARRPLPAPARVLVALACAAVGFFAVTALRTPPADPEFRLPERFRLAGLIEREQDTLEGLQREAARVRADVDRVRRVAGGAQAGTTAIQTQVDDLALAAGLVPMAGPGLEVSLDDSALDESPSGNVNDLVIHSQDVQAVVNALWRAGGEAIAINGQRLVATSAVLCVGNTLLLNGTVHSPPYVVRAVGARRDEFDADPAVQRLRDDARAFGLRFSIRVLDRVTVPGFDGVAASTHAIPVA
jgi:uncharacterized protein YlxW (UPF0749 family)